MKNKSDSSNNKEYENDLNENGKIILENLNNNEIDNKNEKSHNNSVNDNVIQRYYLSSSEKNESINKENNNKKLKKNNSLNLNIKKKILLNSQSEKFDKLTTSDFNKENKNKKPVSQKNIRLLKCNNNIEYNNDNINVNNELNKNILFSELNFQKQINDVNKKLDDYNLLILNLFSTLKPNQNIIENSNNNKNSNNIKINDSNSEILNNNNEKNKKDKKLIPIYDIYNNFTGYYRDINYNYDRTNINDLQNEILKIKQQRIKDKKEIINNLKEIKDIKDILLNEMNKKEYYNFQNSLNDRYMFHHYNFDNEMYKINNSYRVIKSNQFDNKYIDDYYPKVLRRNNPGNYYPKYLNNNNSSLNNLNHSQSLNKFPNFYSNPLYGSIILNNSNKNNSFLPNINLSKQLLNNSNDSQSFYSYRNKNNNNNNKKSMLKSAKSIRSDKNSIESYYEAKKFMRFSELN